MKKIFKYLSLVLFTVLVSACATVKPLPNTKYIVLEPPVETVLDCTVPKPFDKDTYLNGTWSQKEDMLTNLTIKLYDSIGKCNNQMSSIRTWTVNQKQIYKKE